MENRHGGSVTPRKSVIRNAAALMMSQAATWTLATALTVVMPRFLGPKALGQLRIAYSVWAVAEVLISFGTASLLTLEIAKDPAGARWLLGRAIRLRLGFYLCAWPVVMGFLLIGGYSSAVIALTALSGVGTGLLLIIGAVTSALQGLHSMTGPARAQVVAKLVVVVVSIAVLVAGGRVFAYMIVALACTALLAVLVIRSYRNEGMVPQRSDGPTTRQVLSMGVPFVLADALLVVYLQVDTVVVSLLINETQLGWYATADQLFGSLLFVPTIMMTAMLPAIAETAQHDPARVNAMFLRAFSIVILIAFAVGTGTAVLGQGFIDLLYQPDLAKAGPVLSTLGIVTILSYLAIVLGRFAIATGHVRFWNGLMLSSIALSIPLDLVLVPWANDHYGNGALGGALAYIVTESFMVTAGIIRVRRVLVVRPVVLRVTRAAFAATLMAAAIWPLRRQMVLLPVAVGAIVYVGAILATGAIDRDERAALLRVVSPKHRRLADSAQ